MTLADSPSPAAEGQEAQLRVSDVRIPVARTLSGPTPPGLTLRGRLFEPEGRTPEVAAVIHPATGVPRDYYARFARWLAAERGVACLIYGYRATDDRSPRALRRSTVGMSDWGVCDQEAALAWLCARHPDAEIRVVGHSLGGFMTMFHKDAHRVARLIAVASGPAWWRAAPLRGMPMAFLFWHVLGPLAVRALGYLPGSRLGLGEDMPPGVFREWKRWCCNRDLHRPDWGGRLPAPVSPPFSGRLIIAAIEDDAILSPATAARLAEFHPEAESELRVISPRDAGTRAIGHVGLFRQANAAAWPLVWDD
ncbi:alpha/beta hydrolase family protein [Oceanicella actignis]|uniref:alpha/beta hydrolase family protein n=1 Tax=Oceanicella actignis TaxID=1189325 RepID=UPI0011E81928|nr:alpha/beta fold hydrolase [Oceanicella actignis]TYO85406.1 putative alpha/beta hydrolase [Oceanicella actignis]